MGTLEQRWEEAVLPALSAYTAIPCLSPAFEPDWESTGHLAAAAALLADWARSRAIPDLAVELVEVPGRTPLLVAEVPATGPAREASAGCTLIYGHLDKQPPQGQWLEGLGPFQPVRRGDRLYGRGTADDGYALFAALTALEELAASGAAHGRVVVLIEASEESGSSDLDAHLVDLEGRLGHPDLVVCLDSGCLTYDRLWVTTSLRGCLIASVRVDVLEEGVHSGRAGGVVPSSFRLLRRLLSRVEDERTGEILLAQLTAEVPPSQRAALHEVARSFPGAASDDLPVVAGLRLGGSDEGDRMVQKAWAPALAVTGMAGVPALADAGNVLRPFTEAKLSLRIPPTVDAAVAAEALRSALTADPPEGARVTVELEEPADGWLAPDPEPWLRQALDDASRASFGAPAAAYGEGGTIPFLHTLGARFPGAQFVATGVLGPNSNAHGPNEFLHLPMARAVTAAVARLVAAAHRVDREAQPSTDQEDP